jgi:hypothetical protein
MDPLTGNRRGETARHLRLKRLALLYAQAHGYSACAVEVNLPRCRYRADVAAYRLATASSSVGEQDRHGVGSTAIFECKQALPDLRRDNGSPLATQQRLEAVYRRRQVLEKHLRVHYPALRIPESLFAEFDSHNFEKINHHGYSRVIRELNALQNRLFDCTKFEKLVRYRCANLLFLVVPKELFRESEIPVGWGALVQSNNDNNLELVGKATWHDVPDQTRIDFLARIAPAGTRALNRELEITFDDVLAARCRSC